MNDVFVSEVTVDDDRVPRGALSSIEGQEPEGITDLPHQPSIARTGGKRERTVRHVDDPKRPKGPERPDRRNN